MYTAMAISAFLNGNASAASRDLRTSILTRRRKKLKTNNFSLAKNSPSLTTANSGTSSGVSMHTSAVTESSPLQLIITYSKAAIDIRISLSHADWKWSAEQTQELSTLLSPLVSLLKSNH